MCLKCSHQPYGENIFRMSLGKFQMTANCYRQSNVVYMLMLRSKCCINVPIGSRSNTWSGYIWNVPNLLSVGKWQVPSTRTYNVLKMFSLVSRPPCPQCGQLDDGTTTMLTKDRRTDDWVLHVGHWRNSVSSEKGQGELMGSIRCTRIPLILIATNQSHCLPLLILYSANPLVDPKTHTGTGTVELFFVMFLTTPYAYKPIFYI